MRKLLSLPRIAITATGCSAAELLDSVRRALGYTRFVELRLDWVPNPEEALRSLPGLLRHWRAKRPLLLATCRREPNGGRFRGTVAAQAAILEKAAAAGCRLMDLEIESAEALGQDAVAELRERALLILSFHDFEKTPRPQSVARRLERFPADFYKLVGTARRQSDNCAVLDFLDSVSGTDSSRMSKSYGQLWESRWIAFCMGDAGVPSRVLALSRGSRFVYAACPPEIEPTGKPRELAAPGQLGWATLRNRYRAEKLTRRSAIYGLVGAPVGQSIGAAVHNAALRARRCDAVYIPFLVNDLTDFRRAAARYPLAGFSVTIPHKQAVLRSADKADPLARTAGAANTVRVRGKRWEATNTDIPGIVAPLRRALRLGKREPLPADFRAVILGNGGAARGAVLALRELRCDSITVTGRNPDKVGRFARELDVQAMPIEQLERGQFGLLVQTTPVGMWPHAGECPLRPEQISARLVFDLIYNPPQTRLLDLAQSNGCRTISGLEMFLAQAAAQFRYWMGLEPPVGLMRRIALRELRRFPAAARADKEHS